MPANRCPVAIITTLMKAPNSDTTSGIPNSSTEKTAGSRLSVRRAASRNRSHGSTSAISRASATSLRQTQVSNRNASASGSAASREGRLSNSSKNRPRR